MGEAAAQPFQGASQPQSFSFTQRLPQTLSDVGICFSVLPHLRDSHNFGVVESWLGIDSEGLGLPLGFPTDPGWARWVWAVALCYNTVVHWGAIRGRAQAI